MRVHGEGEGVHFPGTHACRNHINTNHESFDDAKFVVDYFGQRSQAVGGAGSIAGGAQWSHDSHVTVM